MRLPLSLLSAADRPFDVLTVGLNSLDLLTVVDPYPSQNTKHRMRAFAQLPGGQSATAAVALARLGWRAKYIGRIGEDAFGETVRQALVAEGVDVADLVRVPGTTQFAVILVDQRTGERTVLWNRHENLDMQPADIPDAAVASARIVHVDCQETAAVASAARRARAAGARTVIDVEQVRPNVDELLRHIDVIIAAEAFPADFTGKPDLGAALAALQAQTGAAAVVVTLGEEGSLARCGGREIRTPAFRVPIVDSTGAGDIFRAGFIAGWLAAEDRPQLEDLLRYANAAAALKCRALGAQTATPRRSEVEALLSTAG